MYIVFGVIAVLNVSNRIITNLNTGPYDQER